MKTLTWFAICFIVFVCAVRVASAAVGANTVVGDSLVSFDGGNLLAVATVLAGGISGGIIGATKLAANYLATRDKAQKDMWDQLVEVLKNSRLDSATSTAAIISVSNRATEAIEKMVNFHKTEGDK